MIKQGCVTLLCLVVSSPKEDVQRKAFVRFMDQLRVEQQVLYIQLVRVGGRKRKIMSLGSKNCSCHQRVIILLKSGPVLFSIATSLTSV